MRKLASPFLNFFDVYDLALIQLLKLPIVSQEALKIEKWIEILFGSLLLPETFIQDCGTRSRKKTGCL